MGTLLGLDQLQRRADGVGGGVGSAAQKSVRVKPILTSMVPK